MSANKRKQSKIKFDQDWSCCCCATDQIDTKENFNWISIQLPHIIDKNDQDTGNWWYRKQFQWKTPLRNDDQRICLIFESLKNPNDDNYSSVENLIVWLNETEIFSHSFPSPKLSIDLTDQLIYNDDSEKTTRQNILIVCCKNTSLCLHTYLLLPHGMTHAIESEEIDSNTNKTSNVLPLRKNRVLDYLVGFNDTDGRFDIGLNSRLKTPTIERKTMDDTSQDGNSNTLSSTTDHILDYLANYNRPDLKSPTSSKHLNSPEILVSEDHDQENSNENPAELYVPRLAIVMLVVGTRGDVQPFVAFGQTLRAAGHRVRLATHEKFRKYIREHGLEFYPLASNPDDLMTFMVKNGGIIPSMHSILDGDVKKKRRDLSDILQSTWMACTDDDDETSIPFTAEVIIANPPSFGHVHCAQKLQIPLHMIFTMPWSPTTVLPHALCKVEHSKISKEKLNLLSYSVVDTLTWSGMHDLVNDFRRKILDLPPLHTRQAIRMLIDEGVPHTYCWSPSLVPRPFDWPPHVNVAGYFFLNNNDKEQFKPPDDLIHFLGLDNNNEEKFPPPIYIGFGSITGNDSHRLLQVILAALERTEYRALLAGFDKENDELPDNILKIGDVPHDWLFEHVSAVCHHGGAGTVAAGLRAGKPTIVIPFFGDQFFWGRVVAENGAGPSPLPGKHVTVDQLVDAFKEVHKRKMRRATERIRDAILREDGCANALRIFHAQLPLSRMRSDLEPTFAACYRVEEFDLQVSRPVAQVLIAAGALDESQFRSHSTQDWASIYDNRVHVPTRGVIKHTHKAFSHIFIQTKDGMRSAVTDTNLLLGVATGVGGAFKNIGQGVGHLSVGVSSLYGEFTDVMGRIPSLYDPFSETDAHERPHVTDFKSGIKAAGLSVGYGWKDGITGFVRKPRIGYRRHGLLGGATGVLVATANSFVKPTVGSLAAVTWLSRGTYASVTKKKDKAKVEHNIIGKSPTHFISPSSPNSDEEEEEDNDDTPANIRFASVISGYPSDICRQILDEFDKMKQHQEKIAATSPNENPKHRHRFLYHRRHSDSAL